MNAGNKVILIIDDNPEYRETATAVIRPVIPAGWEVVAPSTLANAIAVVRSKIAAVHIVFVDYRLNSNAYQPLRDDGMTHEDITGDRVALMIRDISNKALLVGFSAGKNSSLAHLTDASYSGKDVFVKNEPAKQALSVLIAELVSRCDEEWK